MDVPGERARPSTQSKEFVGAVVERDAPAQPGQFGRNVAGLPETDRTFLAHPPSSVTATAKERSELEIEVPRSCVHGRERRGIDVYVQRAVRKSV